MLTLTEAIQVLEKGPEKRTKRDITMITDHFNSYEFFKKLALSTDSETCSSCCKIMQLQVHNKGDKIFDYGKDTMI